MQHTRTVFIILGLLVVALGAGAYVRHQVLEGRTMPGPEPVIDFSSCLDRDGSLDVTGTICTTASGQTYTKPGATLPDTSSTTPPTPAPAPEPIGVSTTTKSTPLSLGKAVIFALHDTHALPDNSTFTLNTIADSRCKPEVQCIWAGEFGTVWTLERNGKTEPVNLGSVRTPTVTKNGYVFTLGVTTETSATLVVTKVTTPHAATSTGTIQGAVTVGPLCPVESVDHPCVVPPETYTSRSVLVYAADHTTELERHALDATGTFTLTLAPGTYGLQIRPAGIGAGEIKPVTVTADTTTTVHFTIDTGIR